MTDTARGLSAVMHALDYAVVHLSLLNPTDRLLFYVAPLVITTDGRLPANVFQDAALEAVPEAGRWGWGELRSLKPGELVQSGPIQMPENNWDMIRYVTLQPIEGIHKPLHPVVSNAVPLARS